MTPETLSPPTPVADLTIPTGTAAEDPSLAAARLVLPRTVAHLEAGRDAGLHPGAQVHVERRGTPVASFALGWARHGLPMATTTKLPWFCCIKPVVAMAFLQLWDDGLVDLDDPVASVLPWFEGGGKERITFRHVLTHSVGLRPDPVYGALDGGRDEARAAIAAAVLPTGTRPGATAYYSGLWGWFVLAEAIEALTGSPYRQAVAERVLRPLGVTDLDLGHPTDAWPDAAADLGLIYDVAAAEPAAFGFLTGPDDYARWAPGAMGFGTAAAYATLISALLPGRHGVLSGPAATAMRSRHRVGFYDAHYSSYLSWGLGVAVDGWHYGRHCAPSTFGHTGLNASLLVADPDAGLVVAAVMNGMCEGPTSLARDRALVDAVYEDLGLAEAQSPSPRVVAVEPSSDPSWKATVSQENHYWRIESKGTPQ